MRQALEKHEQWVAFVKGENAGERIDFTGMDLRDYDLSWAFLDRAILSAVNLSRSDLREINLFEAILDKANLYHANLKGANLSGANLQNARLEGANLQYANLTGADLSNAVIREADFSEANLTNCKMDGVEKFGRPGKLFGAKLDNIFWGDSIEILHCAKWDAESVAKSSRKEAKLLQDKALRADELVLKYDELISSHKEQKCL
jgi:uncharacterized protein YjbI with pentapeptide repeats